MNYNIEYHARYMRDALLGKLYNERATSLEDDELVRCLSRVCRPSNCIKMVQYLRDNGLLLISDIHHSDEK